MIRIFPFLLLLSHLFASGTTLSERVSQGYHEEFIDFVELVYGEGFLSQGGKESVDRMFESIDLNHCRVLDLGSGVGGIDLYLAEEHEVEIVGIDPQPFMIRKANEVLERTRGDLKGTVSFQVMENPSRLEGFESESFDIVMSRESILHLPKEYKLEYFQEIYRVLKPGGKIAIVDWMHSSPIYGEQMKKMMEMDGVSYALTTPEEYLELLLNAGFSDICLTDLTSHQVQVSQGNVDTIQKYRDLIERKYGIDVYEYSLESWGLQRNAFASRELLVGLVHAKK